MICNIQSETLQGGDSSRTFASWTVGRVPGKPCRVPTSGEADHEAGLRRHMHEHCFGIPLTLASHVPGQEVASLLWAYARLDAAEEHEAGIGTRRTSGHGHVPR